MHPSGKKVVFMFSGQGSHYNQMGRDLYESHAVFRTHMDRSDALVQQLLGRSVLDEIYGHPASRPCDDLAIAHPALVMVEHALCETLLSEGLEPDCVWGTSAGEFAAAVAAGVWSLESALAASVEQARQVARSCPPGGMLAVLGSAELYSGSPVIREQTTLAGVNFDRHFVVSGSTASLSLVERHLAERDISCQRLAIPFAFHADGIDAARDAFVRFCHALPPFETPRVAYLSGMTADYLSAMPRSYFWDVARERMRFQEGLTRLEQQQASIFVDCGPAGTSANFIKYSLPPCSRSLCFHTLTAFQQGRANLAVLKQQLAVADA